MRLVKIASLGQITIGVCFGDVVSGTLPVLLGVPQGAVLGPLLFSLFVNDVPDVLKSRYHLYASDVQLYAGFPLDGLNVGINMLNDDLRAVSDWAETNMLSLNPGKSQAMVVYNRAIDTNSLRSLVVNGTPIIS